MRYVYSLLLYLLTPALLVYLLVRGVADRRWWSRWPERFGDFDATGWMRGIVVHAVSVGEVNAAAPLIRALQQHWPDLEVTVTCFTPTGSERIRALFGDSVHHLYAPIDLPGAVRRFFRALKPRLLIVMETELWPNLFQRARGMDIPILVANARLTGRSARAWGRFASLAAQALQCATLIAAQSEEDARRFVKLGANPDRTRSVGNLKFDIDLPPDVAQRGRQWRARWGADRTVLVAGSTHEEDERALLGAFSGVLDRFADALLVLAPRYPERFGRAFEQASVAGFAVARLSDGQPGRGVQCLVIDGMGELLALYAAADIAFVGGTLAPVGGHNPLEAAALGRALIFGPQIGHIEGLAASLISAGAAIEVEDEASLLEAWMSLQSDPAVRERMGRAARQLVERERGALQRSLDIVGAILFQ
jgi:3-deoxy-D-manno-octulosonic-acid transferase